MEEKGHLNVSICFPQTRDYTHIKLDNYTIKLLCLQGLYFWGNYFLCMELLSVRSGGPNFFQVTSI